MHRGIEPGIGMVQWVEGDQATGVDEVLPAVPAGPRFPDIDPLPSGRTRKMSARHCDDSWNI
jgi:hypothetical protein